MATFIEDLKKLNKDFTDDFQRANSLEPNGKHIEETPSEEEQSSEDE